MKMLEHNKKQEKKCNQFFWLIYEMQMIKVLFNTSWHDKSAFHLVIAFVWSKCSCDISFDWISGYGNHSENEHCLKFLFLLSQVKCLKH